MIRGISPQVSTPPAQSADNSRSIGNPTTAADDVWVDGKFITAENYDSARRFGQVIAARLRG